MKICSGAMFRKGGSGLSGFKVWFDRHHHFWRWREDFPNPRHKRLKHVIEAHGFRSRSEAVKHAKAELERREALVAAKAPKPKTKPGAIDRAVAARALSPTAVHRG